MSTEYGRADGLAPLIFVPGLGGEDEHTRRLVSLLECAFAVSVSRMPDIETPCPQIYRIADLSNQIAEQVRATARTGDAIVAGYSIGGVLAYEAACRLIEKGYSPACVALFDTSPRLVDSEPSISCARRSGRLGSDF